MRRYNPIAVAYVAIALAALTSPSAAQDQGLWKVYNESLKGAKYRVNALNADKAGPILLYRGFCIYCEPKPIPSRSLDYAYIHAD